MNKVNLINKITNNYKELGPKIIKKIVDELFLMLSETIARGDRVEVRRLGAFSVRHRVDSEALNKSRKVVYFRASKSLSAVK